MLFITLGDRPIDPSPRPLNQLTGPTQPRATDRARVTNPCAPHIDPRAHRVDPRPRSKLCPNQADVASTEPTDPARPQHHATQSFSRFALLF
jgi:hypothetical protein